MLLDGKKYAEAKLVRLKLRVADLEEKPTLAIIQVSGDSASDTYVQNKLKRCFEVGIIPKLFYYKPNVKQSEIEEKIKELNQDPSITGIFLQLPLPDHLSGDYLTNLIDPEKDVDGFTETNVGRLSLGKPGLFPCTAKGVIDLLDFYNTPLEGADVLIINRSNIVGKPLAQMFLRRNATVTIAHSKTKNLKDKVKLADIVVTGVGIPNFLRYDSFTQGTTIIDISINHMMGELMGDVKKSSYGYLEKTCNLTPVPGGVGQATVIALLENVIQIAEEKQMMGEIRDNFKKPTTNVYVKSTDQQGKTTYVPEKCTKEQSTRLDIADIYGNIYGFIPWSSGQKTDGSDNSIKKTDDGASGIKVGIRPVSGRSHGLSEVPRNIGNQIVGSDLDGDKNDIIDALSMSMSDLPLPDLLNLGKSRFSHIYANNVLFTSSRAGKVTIDANTYQKSAARTINPGLYDYEVEQHALHGMIGEIGEIHSLYQKTYQGHEFDEEHAKKEVGDLLWFIAEYCTAMNWDLGGVMVKNLDKLEARFPNGFEEEKSLNRDPKDI